MIPLPPRFPSGPATGSLNGFHLKSKFLAANNNKPGILAGIRLLSIAALLPWSNMAEGAGELGPVFEINGKCEHLATRADGMTAIIDTLNTQLPELNANLRELRIATVSAGATNQSPFDIRWSVAGPGGRFYYATPDIAIGTSGGVAVFVEKVVVVVGEPDQYSIKYFLLDPDGGYASDTVLAGSGESWIDEWVVPRVARNQAGQFAVVWFDQSYTTDHYARGRIFGADGQPLGSAFTLNDQPHQNGHYAAFNAAAAIAPDGSSVYVWEDAYLAKGSVYVGHESIGHDIYARRVDAAGNPVGSQFRVNTTTNCRHGEAEIGMAADGSFVVVWTQTTSSADGIYMRRYQADGTPLESERRISPTLGWTPKLAMAGDGRFVVVWEGPDSDSHGIFAQRFLSDGSPYGSMLWVNQGLVGSQSDPLVGLADDGMFIVKWSDGINNHARWIAWDATTSPFIITQPQDVNTPVGSNVIFTVSAAGTLPLSYQWMFNGAPIVGATNATFSLTDVQSSSGGEYYVVISNLDGDVVSGAATLGGVNDHFVDQILITGTNSIVKGSNLSATRDPGEPNYAYSSKSVWWAWTAPSSGIVVISTIGSGFDTILRVFTGTSVSNLTSVAYNDDGGGNETSLLCIAVTAGTTYLIDVEGVSGTSGSITLSISFGLPVFSCPVMSNGLFQCQLNGPARGSYTIKASSNLTEWTPIITGVLPTSGVAIITDSASTNYNRRFYRAVMP